MSENAPPLQLRNSFRVPADHYCAPAVDLKPLFPRWVSLGCGWASALFLIVLFSGASFVSGGGLGQFMDTLLGMMGGEMDEMYAPNVTEDQKTTLDTEIERLRESVRTGRVPATRLQPVVKMISEISADRTITPEEVDDLTGAVRDAGKPAPKPAPTGTP